MDISISSVLKDWLKGIILSDFPTTLIFRIADDIVGRCHGDRAVVEIERMKDNKIFSSIFITREDIEDAIEYNSSNGLTFTNETNLDKLVHALLSSLDKPGRHDSQSIRKI
ncbi:MAG: hypothetical protein K2Q14_01505 [Gammaproteobacteria bacterium]|nr:hypothetical protein [Gammaproteobacteria bacterium]MBY0544206.1 hypothetical protein [Gammaproteobacteria bacterium]